MFGHDGDDYDEELVSNDKFMRAANEMFNEQYPRSYVLAKLKAMNCDRVEAERICNQAEKVQEERRIRYAQFVKAQRDVKERNRREMEQSSKERKIGISRIRDDDDYVRTR